MGELLRIPGLPKVLHSQFVVWAQVVALAAIMVMPRTALSEEAPDLERRIKAAYLHKFVSYVEWPEGTFERPDSAVVIGVAGADEFATELDRSIAGRNVNNRLLLVQRLGRDTGLDDTGLDGVHILFIGGRTNNRAELFELAQDRPILTVTETQYESESGGAINLLVLDNRVRFDVSLAAVERSGMRLSSALLSVARKVRGMSL